MLSPQSTNDSLAPSSTVPSNGNLTTVADPPTNGAHATLPPLSLNVCPLLSVDRDSYSEIRAVLLSEQGSTIVVTTRSGGRYEGSLSSNDQSQPGISLRDAKDLVNPNATVIPTYFIPAPQIANWKRPDPVPSTTVNGNKVMQNGELPRAIAYQDVADRCPAPTAFATDKDISGASSMNRERELQPWAPEGPAANGGGGLPGDSATFGSGAAGGSWDQFAANESLFGVTTDYKEEIYTTKLDRKTSDYKDRERKAQIIADEISSVRERTSLDRAPVKFIGQ